jgi:hypothetical protein
MYDLTFSLKGNTYPAHVSLQTVKEAIWINVKLETGAWKTNKTSFDFLLKNDLLTQMTEVSAHDANLAAALHDMLILNMHELLRSHDEKFFGLPINFN